MKSDRRDQWWRENRREAVDLFTREHLDVLDMLRTNPDAGTLYQAVRFEVPVPQLLVVNGAFTPSCSLAGDRF